jgi:hypothetical protein
LCGTLVRRVIYLYSILKVFLNEEEVEPSREERGCVVDLEIKLK